MMDQSGNMIRNLLQSNGVDPQAQRASMEAMQFANAHGPAPQDPNAMRQYGNALADFLRQRGHNVTVNDNLPH